MGIIRLGRAIKAPIRRAAHHVNVRHSVILQQLMQRHQSAPPAPDIWFPEDDGENELSSYPCDKTGDQPYSDQYRVLNPNPVTITSSPIQLALENRKRKEMFIVNVSTVSILIAFGFIPTATVYTLPLQACGVANDGTGGVIIDQAFQGQVWAVLASSAVSNGALLFTELPE